MQSLQFNQVKNVTWLIIMAQNLKSYLQIYCDLHCVWTVDLPRCLDNLLTAVLEDHAATSRIHHAELKEQAYPISAALKDIIPVQ